VLLLLCAECPFAHEGEKATRRCPALYGYSSIVCPDTRQVSNSRRALTQLVSLTSQWRHSRSSMQQQQQQHSMTCWLVYAGFASGVQAPSAAVQQL
jgi:hypothetical protein